MADKQHTAKWRENMRSDERQELASAWDEREMAVTHYQAISKQIKDRVIKRMIRAKEK